MVYEYTKDQVDDTIVYTYTYKGTMYASAVYDLKGKQLSMTEFPSPILRDLLAAEGKPDPWERLGLK